MGDSWAATRARTLLAALRGETEREALRLLRDALEGAAGDAARRVLELEEEVRLHEKLEPVREQVVGRLMESNTFGQCRRCGRPYMEGDTIWWNGPGQGALCEPCSEDPG